MKKPAVAAPASGPTIAPEQASPGSLLRVFKSDIPNLSAVATVEAERRTRETSRISLAEKQDELKRLDQPDVGKFGGG
jgi:hypothetical protein